MSTALHLFYKDLRVQDNALLAKLSAANKPLICAYFPINEVFSAPHSGYAKAHYSHNVKAFRSASIHFLNAELAKQNQTVLYLAQFEQLCALIEKYDVSELGLAYQVGTNEQLFIDTLKARFAHLKIVRAHTYTLFDQHQLPFDIDHIPDTFSRFRRAIERGFTPELAHYSSANHTVSLAAPPQGLGASQLPLDAEQDNGVAKCFRVDAKTALESYFQSTAASEYKETRNALMGERFSTGISPWLANGRLSVGQVMQALKSYEQTHGANQSTYWIYFELLWREYFQWLGFKADKALFTRGGLVNKKPATSFYPQRFKAWCEGNTPYPLVNALMNQLKRTGWMSNRGRQIAASCLVNELNLDWRYGAHYFEQQLIDYDVASNYGNWQYIAGVGADPQGGRHFNLEKQTEIFDPEGEFINRFDGATNLTTNDPLDAHDWPVGASSDDT